MSDWILSLYKMWKDQDILLITNPVLAILSRAQVLHICVFSTTKSSTTKMTYSFCLNWALHLTTPNSENSKWHTQRDVNVGWIFHVRTCVCRKTLVWVYKSSCSLLAKWIKISFQICQVTSVAQKLTVGSIIIARAIWWMKYEIQNGFGKTTLIFLTCHVVKWWWSWQCRGGYGKEHR